MRLDMAVDIQLTQSPKAGRMHAAETLLIHKDVAKVVLPRIVDKLKNMAEIRDNGHWILYPNITRQY